MYEDLFCPKTNHTIRDIIKGNYRFLIHRVTLPFVKFAEKIVPDIEGDLSGPDELRFLEGYTPMKDYSNLTKGQMIEGVYQERLEKQRKKLQEYTGINGLDIEGS
jgi:hypothetical protein